jgi:CRISPR/Cas system-associated exonuclease Cas4 (RecB family)
MQDYSHSKLEIARKCMRLFKNKYIDKIKVDDKNDYNRFGNLLHEVIENYTGTGLEELVALYHKFYKKHPYTDNALKARAPIALKNIHSTWKKYIKDSKGTIVHEEDVKVQLNDTIKLNGKIDILIVEDDKLYIKDLKTSKNNKYGNFEAQIAMYMLLLHIKYDIPYSDMDGEIIYLCMEEQDKHGNVIKNLGLKNIVKPIKLDVADVEMLKEEIIHIDEKINRAIVKDVWKASPTWFNCTFCPYASTCADKYTGN